MPNTKPATAQRTNRAFRIAYLADLASIHYTITLDAFIHSWAVLVISILIPSAYTVLEFLAALNRSKTTGYIGIAVAYELLAPRVAKATRRKCSKRTLERGLAALKALGLVELRPWTMPDYRATKGDHTVIVKGTAKVEIGGGRWSSRQIRIVVLTDRALALWDRATRSAGDRELKHYPTPAKLADNSQVEQIDKSIMLESVTSNDGKSDPTRNTMLDFEPTPAAAPERDTSNGLEGRPTRPTSSTSSRSFEHEALTPQKPVDRVDNDKAPRGASNDPPVFAPTAPGPPPAGCDRTRPKALRGAPARTWNTARRLILREVHKALSKYSHRQANAIFDRAKYELSRNYPAGWPTSCDWPYWVGRFPGFTAAQMAYHVKRDIIPLLKHPAAITPGEPRRYREGWSSPAQPDPPPANLEVPGDLPEFLAKLAKKFTDD